MKPTDVPDIIENGMNDELWLKMNDDWFLFSETINGPEENEETPLKRASEVTVECNESIFEVNG